MRDLLRGVCCVTNQKMNTNRFRNLSKNSENQSSDNSGETGRSILKMSASQNLEEESSLPGDEALEKFC